MAASVTSPADVINLALAALGHPGRVGSLYDGSPAAKKALDVYAETRDEVLRSRDWPFALRQSSGIPTASVIFGWAHTWTYPADCLRVRQVLPAAGVQPLDPQPVLWSLFNDQAQFPPTKIIVSQISPVTIYYVGQITDMTTWEPLFVGALVNALATKLGPALKDIAPALDPLAAVAQATAADEPQAPDNAAGMTMTAPAQRAPAGRPA